MSKTTLRRILHINVAIYIGVPMSSGLQLRVAHAQVPQATAVAGTERVAHAAQAASPPADPAPDAGASDDFIHRYPPQSNLWEAGLFVGGLFISDQNSFRGTTVVNPGGPPTVQPVSRFAQPAIEMGMRGGYFPLSFAGAELEGMVAVAQTDVGNGATVLAARAQAVVQLPYWSVVPFAVGGVGYWQVFNDVSGDDSDPAFHFGAGAKVNVTRSVAVRLDVRDSITNQRANHDYPHNIEALAGANLVFGRAAAEPADHDADGVIDQRDDCPFEAGTAPSGCPIRDSDSDGVNDREDQCAMEVGIAPSGCPIRDADQDGVVDAEDQCISDKGGAPTGCPDADQDGYLDRADRCPSVPGVAPDGCPADEDGDGLIGADDRCPDRAETTNGFEDTDGCPDEMPAAVKNFMGVIAGIEFDPDRAAIRPSSQLALEKAISVLTEYPSLRIEIVGHTDDQGSREHNLDLSLRRAEAVKQSLIARGIEANRIQAKGEGPDAPLSSNDTPEGRQKNRRVEFRIIQ